MKIRPLLVVAAWATASFTSAQNTSDLHSTDQPFFGNNIPENSLSLESKAYFGSSTLNSKMAMDYLLNPTFSASAKDAFLANETSKSNSELDLEVRGTMSCNDWIFDKISIAYYNRAFVSTSGDAAKLILFGNKQFAGNTVRFGSSQALLYSGYGIDFTKKVKLNEKVDVEVIGGIGLVNNVFNAQASNIDFYTETNGEHIDVTLTDFQLLQNNSGTAGINLNFGAVFSGATSNGKWSVQITDIKPTFLFNSTNLTLDSSFRFDGIQLSVSDFKGDGIANRIEEDYTSAYNANLEKQQAILLPSTLQAEYIRNINTKHSIGAKVSAIRLGLFGANGEVKHMVSVNEKLVFESTIGYGSFRGPYLSEKIFYTLNSIQLMFEIRGVSSLVAPSKLGAIGSRLAVAIPI